MVAIPGASITVETGRMIELLTKLLLQFLQLIILTAAISCETDCCFFIFFLAVTVIILRIHRIGNLFLDWFNTLECLPLLEDGAGTLVG